VIDSPAGSYRVSTGPTNLRTDGRGPGPGPGGYRGHPAGPGFDYLLADTPAPKAIPCGGMRSGRACFRIRARKKAYPRPPSDFSAYLIIPAGRPSWACVSLMMLNNFRVLMLKIQSGGERPNALAKPRATLADPDAGGGRAIRRPPSGRATLGAVLSRRRNAMSFAAIFLLRPRIRTHFGGAKPNGAASNAKIQQSHIKRLSGFTGPSFPEGFASSRRFIGRRLRQAMERPHYLPNPLRFGLRKKNDGKNNVLESPQPAFNPTPSCS